jgi:predicted nucleotidyltransferase
MPKSNIELLKEVATRLGPLRKEVVFVGGCATALLVTDAAGAEVRSTLDVDVIAELASYADYAAFSERLRSLGFHEDTRKGAPLCRWLFDDLILDVMPVEERIFGFTNRWYRGAMESANTIELEPGLQIRLVNAAYFVATKLEAFKGRGRGDYASSHDLEDLLTVVDGRPEIVAEIAAAEEIRSYIAQEFRELLEVPQFVDALRGYLLPDAASQARLPILTGRIKEASK